MLVTEEEAKERWCPFARAYETVLLGDEETWRPATLNRTRSGRPDPDCSCIASQCMAWRWGPDDAALNERMHGRDAQPELGYCGLAGKP